MTVRERATLVLCIALHAWVLWNVYHWSLLTPRILNFACP